VACEEKNSGGRWFMLLGAPGIYQGPYPYHYSINKSLVPVIDPSNLKYQINHLTLPFPLENSPSISGKSSIYLIIILIYTADPFNFLNNLFNSLTGGKQLFNWRYQLFIWR